MPKISSQNASNVVRRKRLSALNVVRRNIFVGRNSIISCTIKAFQICRNFEFVSKIFSAEILSNIRYTLNLYIHFWTFFTPTLSLDVLKILSNNEQKIQKIHNYFRVYLNGSNVEESVHMHMQAKTEMSAMAIIPYLI